MPSPPRPARRPWRTAAALLSVALVAAALSACASDAGAGADRPRIVVTTTVLGALVDDLAGGRAEVTVLIPNGADPHDYQPSAKDVEAIADADLVVENGLRLEEGLEDALSQARADGVPVFTATDHARLLAYGAGAGDEIAEHGPDDPHIWTSPIAMRQVVAALGPVLSRDLGIAVGARTRALERRLTGLDREVEATLAVIPAARRTLVTGHESMGYFADRYGFELVGALIPSLSSQAQVSAANLGALRAQVEREGVPAIFNEAGTPDGVASAIASEAGARVIEIDTHAIPADGSYFGFMRALAASVADGLAPARAAG